MAAEITTSPENARNQGTAWRAPTKTRAPSGEVIAHRQTADEFSKPPRLHCSANGSASGRISWLWRKRA